ncbi:MAG TPA: hypothetical protein DHV16_05590 [Nitrospiraceae bacterium]|nr:MAG: hypothetical protein A2Z82_03500 [Nitrospirae bacterium GWA2_46_11]OGW24379.1 MAG: hypothetical protein A2X55_00305 [Nitrospirae bacterium GWB2_47_37]HCZ11719.1 hypothetical protein [Nitrospiraceae bacterium]
MLKLPLNGGRVRYKVSYGKFFRHIYNVKIVEVIMEQGSWELMVKRIYKQSVVALTAAAVISIFFTEWRFSLSVLIGGLVGIGNLKGIVWSVTALLGAGQARAKMMILGMFRLLVISSVLIILAIFGIIKAYGLLAGFTIVFIIMVKEGLLAAKREN